MAQQVWWSQGTPTCPRCLAAIQAWPDRWECTWCGFTQTQPDIVHVLRAQADHYEQQASRPTGMPAHKRYSIDLRKRADQIETFTPPEPDKQRT